MRPRDGSQSRQGADDTVLLPAIAMLGNHVTKYQALEWLKMYGTSVRGYPQEAAAAYLGLGTKRFRSDVASGRLPQPERHGKLLVWDKLALDRSMDKALGIADGADGVRGHDPIMVSINNAA